MSSKTEKAPAPAAPAGIRLHELAKEIGIASKDLLEKAIALGIPKIKSHASILTHGQADRLRAKFGGVKKLKAELDENKAAKARYLASERHKLFVDENRESFAGVRVFDSFLSPPTKAGK